MRFLRRGLGLLLLLLLASALWAPPASAHTRLLEVTPAEGSVLATAPGTVELRFNEPVTVVESAFALYDSAGRHTVDGLPSMVEVTSRDQVVTATLPAELVRGSYLLSWRVVSADGHPIGGATGFAVGEPSAPPVAPAPDAQTTGVNRLHTGLQVLSWLGLLGGVGLWVFRRIVAPLGTRVPGGRRLVTAGLALSAVTTTLLVGASGVQEAGGRVSDLAQGWAWRDGAVSAPGLALALVVVGGTLVVVADRLPPSTGRVLGLLGSLVALTSLLATGHTRSVGPGWLMGLMDLVHVGAGAVWSGGLAGLGLFLLAARRRPDGAVATAAVVARFSALAGVLVALLGASGLGMAVLVLDRPADLTGTGWGRALLAKLALVAVVGLLAAWNRFHLVGSVRRPSAPLEQWRRLRSAVVDEAVIVVLALAVTGVLVGQSPRSADGDAGPAAVAAAAAQRVELGEGSVHLKVSGGGPGPRTAELSLRQADGNPLLTDAPPTVTLSLPERGLGPMPVPVRSLEQPGRYAADMNLPVSGQWQMLVSVRTSRFDEPTAVLVVPVSG